MQRESQGPQVYFGRTQSRDPIPPKSILITPTEHVWNDFGHHTRILYRIRSSESADEHHAIGFIGFYGLEEGEINGAKRLDLLAGASPDGRILAKPEHKFFTMLPSLEAYRQLVLQMGPAPAIEALIAVYDLVAVSEFNTTSRWIDEAVNTEVFALSFIRNFEGFFAYKSASSVLHGLEAEELGVLSESLRIRFRLAGRQNDHDLRFRFNHRDPLPRRIAVIIGKNGVGKSQTLGRIVRAAISGSRALTDENRTRPIISRVLAFAPTNEAESVFPADQRKVSRLWYRRFSLNRSRRSRRNDYVSDLIVQLARSDQRIKDKSRWKIFRDALETIDSSDQIHIPTRERGHIHLSELTIGGEQALLERFALVDSRREPLRVIDGKGYPLSSGEISFLKFAAQVSLHIENGSLLLLDEPETHLHPNFVSRFVALLDNLLAQTGSAAIVATHSVYFVREVFREQVTVLRMTEAGRVEAAAPALHTFGADVGAISYFVFGEDEPSKLAAEVQDGLLKENLSWESLYERYRNDLSLEFLTDLRALKEGKKGGQ